VRDVLQRGRPAGGDARPHRLGPKLAELPVRPADFRGASLRYARTARIHPLTAELADVGGKCQSSGPTCNQGYVQRTVWDGSQQLYEIQTTEQAVRREAVARPPLSALSPYPIVAHEEMSALSPNPLIVKRWHGLR
jgi:hypothetical protein